MMNKKIRIIVADDEEHARMRLMDLLDRFGNFEVVAQACDGNQALNMIITHNPDVAFLDINMPGISVFQSLPSLNKPPIIVFQTAYSQYAMSPSFNFVVLFLADAQCLRPLYAILRFYINGCKRRPGHTRCSIGG